MKDKNGNKTYMNYIRRFYHSLFIPLQEEMNRNLQKTEQLFGRLNGHYCKSIDINARPDIDRYLWINVRADNNIEFRLNKFVSGKQYQNLMKMEVEMVQCIVRNFCEHFNDSNNEIDITRYWREVNGERVVSKTKYRKHKAEVTANKLVKIYQKYTNN